MMIRTFERKRCIAWTAVLAIVLLSVMPTVSQIVLRHAPHVHASMAHAQHMGHAATAGDRDDDCWRKCGYCDFLAHTPALATIAHLPAFTGTAIPAPLARPSAAPRFAKPLRLAQPRGPPSVLA